MQLDNIVLTGVDTYLDIDLLSLHIMLLSKLPSSDYALLHIIKFHTTLCLIKELTSQLQKYSSGPMLMEFNLSYYFPHGKKLA